MAEPYVSSGYVDSGYADSAAGYVASGYVATGYVVETGDPAVAQNIVLPLLTQDAEIELDNPLLRTVVHAATLALPTQIAQIATARLAAHSVTLGLPFQNGIIRGTPIVPLPPTMPVEEPLPVRVTGDAEDMMARQIAVLPPWWGAPGIIPATLRLPLAMSARVGAWLHALFAYARLQTRIKTATGGWLDLIAWDFFGRRIRRRAGQPDDSFRRRILAEMFRPRATRPAMASALRDLTGREPRIFEPSRPQDTGGIGIPSGLAIGTTGAIGSLALPGNVFIDVYRSPDAGIAYAAGIGTPAGGIGIPSRLVIANLDLVRGALTDADVYGAIEATRPAGIIVWTRMHY